MNIDNKLGIVKVLDGGFGSQISRRAGERIDGDALWSGRFLHTNKQAVVDTHLDFLHAGSDIIVTNTYQASIGGFMEHLNLSEQESYELIKEAVHLAKRARNTYLIENSDKINSGHLIAGSVGPYAASLCDGSEYTGYNKSVSKDFLLEWHKPRIKALLEGGVDLLAFETFPCRVEAQVLLEYIKEFKPVKAWISFNCRNEKLLASGENFQETVRKCYDLNPNQLVRIGANCVSPDYVSSLFSGISDGREKPLPLIVYPNSGATFNKEDGKWSDNESCRPIHTYVHEWLDLGINWIGGCCGVYSDDIINIKREVKEWQHKNN